MRIGGTRRRGGRDELRPYVFRCPPGRDVASVHADEIEAAEANPDRANPDAALDALEVAVERALDGAGSCEREGNLLAVYLPYHDDLSGEALRRTFEVLDAAAKNDAFTV